MILTKDEVLSILKDKIYGTLVTIGKKGLSSRTMTFGYWPEDKLFMLTHKGTAKLDDILFNPRGLVHISSIEDNITESFDISIEGEFQIVDHKNALYDIGKEVLGKKNPMVKNIMSNEETRTHYELLVLNIKSLSAWNYLQILNGEPKTILF